VRSDPVVILSSARLDDFSLSGGYSLFSDPVHYLIFSKSPF
jgi:hypothetical protein